MLDKEQINKNKQDTIIKLSILMMIADRDIHDAEYQKVIEIIDKHSMYNISEDEITELVSEISFLREQKSLEKMADELASKLKSNFLPSHVVLSLPQSFVDISAPEP